MNNKPTTKTITTDSDISINPVYCSPVTLKEKPGEFPFTRGIYPDMYRTKPWTIRQYAGFSSAKESNKRYSYLLSQGVSGLSVAFDLPTQIGYDSDEDISLGEVGKVGVAIDSLLDMDELFDGINLENVTTSMTINATSYILLALYVARAKKQNCSLQNISGTIQNDILKEYIARGTYIYPPRPSMKIITDIFEWCSDNLPKWNTISISGYHMREAGANAVQEVAFTLANGKAYVKAALDAGLPIDAFGSRLSFFFNVHNHLFEEVAKFRAARKMWANIMKDFGATTSRAMMLRFHSQTAGSTLTAQQISNNIIRTAVQTMAATLGGTQSLHTNGFDEAIGLPTQEAATIALRTQQIIANESGLTDVADPLGGSYFIEELTNEIERKALQEIHKIDKMGGSIQAIEQGYMQDQIAMSAFSYQKNIESKDKIIVGLNAFQEKEDNGKAEVFKVDDSVRNIQVEKLKTLRQQRDNNEVTTKLSTLKQVAQEEKNIMPNVIDCVENMCTLGEIATTLRQVYGEYQP